MVIITIIIITIMVHKGLRDIISDGRDTVECGAAGSPRRCGVILKNISRIIAIVIILNLGSVEIKMTNHHPRRCTNLDNYDQFVVILKLQ